MKNLRNLLFLILCFTFSVCVQAQSIDLTPMDPHPDVKGGLFGGISLFDMDGDGDNDLYISGREDGWVSQDHSTFYLNDGLGNFTEMLNPAVPGLQSANSAFEDVDGDGDLDLFVNGRSGGSGFTGLFLNNGLGTFTLSGSSSVFAQCEQGDLELLDLDGDNDIDAMLTGNTHPADVHIQKIYLNDGMGNFTELANTGLDSFHIDEFELADTDGDGDIDILGLGQDENNEVVFSWYINNGLNQYSQVNSGLNDLGGGDFATGDIDSDGDVDVLISGSSMVSNEVEVHLYLNDGIGNYSILPTGDTFKKVSIGQNDFVDLDNDGDLDVVMTGSGAGGGVNIHTTLYENLGNNSYMQSDSLVGSYLSSTEFGDINGDNLADFVLSGTTVGDPTFKTWIFLNETDTSNNTIEGCTNSGACNFDPTAITEDGSCEYLEGDGNVDGEVNILDLTSISSHFGCNSDCFGNGDGNSDGEVNILDIVAVSSNYNETCP